FIIMAFVVFLLVKFMSKIAAITEKPPAAEEPATRKCPFCLSDIDINAIRCPACTSNIDKI
ncbi:MAG: MscL family protein, partial [Clostridiales bacterium]|nr:MscL family protein [Clostridiales bacterium]